MLEIKGALQNFDWGGYHYIKMLTGIDANQDKPLAELWLGDHANGSAQLVDGSLLSDWIKQNPEHRLGQRSLNTYGNRLPYLFKILDVKQPLSIQVHPSLEQARAGFAKENQARVPINQRNYRDDNHKPELMLALSDFYLLHGFREASSVAEQLQKIKELVPLASIYKEKGLRQFVSFIFDLSKQELGIIVNPVVERYRNAYKQNELSKSDPLFWFMRSALRAEKLGQEREPGLLMIFILNLMYVPKGKVVFQDAGIPHAYLEGQNIELMANSDNVLRGGLTSKHVDISELLKVINFEHVIPETVQPVRIDNRSIDFSVPVRDFQLREYILNAGERLVTPEHCGACIWFVLSGELKLDNQQHFSNAGSAFYQRPGEVNSMLAHSDVVLYRTSSIFN
ncbi:mannose-6-phosphate isomerase, class I [Vibrio sp. TH_r3]|uniref:mannose-6-phosphate isomerase, class I n=1 Tax=Vibrio sp. TH_r3 TaxID=3082084 RepID=UPI0029551FC8|nr:mannose-6-phosphate isomerase, class I [Vibrio sp. TH_r3]MDV7105109.1 mannose-6-phosphate isomerase, class I [Vibrio sp. TH_r3]